MHCIDHSAGTKCQSKTASYEKCKIARKNCGFFEMPTNVQMHSLYELQCAIMVIGLFVSNVFFSLSLLRLYVYRLCAQFDFEILRINRYKQM